MFESGSVTTTAALEALVATLSRVVADVADAERIDQLGLLEKVKSACAAAQARITVDFADSQEQVASDWSARARAAAEQNDFEGWRTAREQARRATVETGDADPDARMRHGRRSRRPGQAVGVAGQVALARRESPSRGSRHLTTALALVRQMPHTLAALESGVLSEWRAELVVRETAMLTTDQRTDVDTELATTLGDELGRLGDRELVRRVQALAYRVDAASVVARSRAAESQRRVSIRPAPDTMAYVTALLPVAQGVAVHAALTVAAATARAAGDERTKGQVMADTFVQRVTGQTEAPLVPVEVQVVMTERALLHGDDTPALVPGYGAVPAAWARRLLAGHCDQPGTAQVWLRRLYTHPADGTLVAMDSARRVFDGALRRLLVARDITCRTPWCDAAIAHLDHVTDHAAGGPTTAQNGQGLCVRCNHTKQLAGWSARSSGGSSDPGTDRAGPHTVLTRTPTGHSYRSTAPPVLPGAEGPAFDQLDRLRRLLAA